MNISEIVRLFEEIELRLIGSLKRNLRRHRDWEKAEGFEWPAWQAEKLRNLDHFRRENQALLSDYIPLIDEETAALLREQFAEGTKEAVNGGPAVLKGQQERRSIGEEHFFGVAEPRVNALIEDIQQNFHRAESATLRLMDDVYRKTILRAETALASGAVTLPQAVDMATKDFLASGINCIEYRNGSRVNIASYAEMALRTAAARSKFRGEAVRRREIGVDTVLVTQYGGCSKTCLPWQGRVYIDDVWGEFQGESDGSRGKSSNGNWYPLLSAAIDGGLFHPNCRHGLSTWIEGVSRIPPPLDEKAISRHAKLEAVQRGMEREIRKWKRMAEGAQQPEAARHFMDKASHAQKRLRAFIRENDDVLRRDPWREQTLGVSLDKSRQNAILESEIKREAGIRGALHLEPVSIDVESLGFDDEHVNAQREHGISEELSRSYIRDARISVSVWDGQFERYYGYSGAAYVDRLNHTIRTAFGSEEFDAQMKLILEVLRKYGI